MEAAQLQETVSRRLRQAIHRSGKPVSQISMESGVYDRTIYEYTGRKRPRTVPSTPTLVNLREVQMNTVKNYQAMKYITDTLSEAELLQQLAEESAELARAALKAIRAYQDSNNPTDTDPAHAYMNVLEEVVDVANAYTALTGDWCAMAHLSMMCRHSPKWKRWRKRVRKAQRKKQRHDGHDE